MKAWLWNLLSQLRARKLDLAAEDEHKRIAEAAYIAMCSIHGQLLLKYLIQEIYDTASHVLGLTPYDTAFNEGQRATVKHILDLMNEHSKPPEGVKVETEEKE